MGSKVIVNSLVDEVDDDEKSSSREGVMDRNKVRLIVGDEDEDGD